MSAYESKPDGMQAINDRLARIEAAMRAAVSANGAESLVITGDDGITAYDPDTGSRIQLARGYLAFWDDYDNQPDQYGLILCDPGAGLNILRQFPPFSDGTGLGNSFTMQGRRDGLPGNGWWYADGSLNMRVQDDDAELVGLATLGAARVDITANHLGLYGLPTTSSGPNVHLGMVAGEWTAALVTSSRRYKQDIDDAPIDDTAPLRWRPRAWRDRNEVDVVGDDADVHHGFIAEEIHDESPACVRLDDQGRPDSLRQMHMLAEVVALCQAQQKQLDEQASQLANLTARLEDMEAK